MGHGVESARRQDGDYINGVSRSWLTPRVSSCMMHTSSGLTNRRRQSKNEAPRCPPGKPGGTPLLHVGGAQRNNVYLFRFLF